MWFINEAIMHFGIGFGIALVASLLFWASNSRRFLFRFGGKSPLSLGYKKNWVLWYILSYGFEFFTSFLWGVGDRMYRELALSSMQAIFFTIGLFVIDRVATWLEPSKYFYSSTKVVDENAPMLLQEIQTRTSSPEARIAEQANQPSPVASPPSGPTLEPTTHSGSLLGETVAELQTGITETAARTGGRLMDLPSVFMTEWQKRSLVRKTRREEAIRTEKEARKQSVAELKKSLVKY